VRSRRVLDLVNERSRCYGAKPLSLSTLKPISPASIPYIRLYATYYPPSCRSIVCTPSVHLATMASCSLDGSSDMYGLGIHLGFYLQWYSSILASWLAPSEIEGLRFTNSLFVAPTFFALITPTANDVSSLQPVDICVTLLLKFGYSLFLIPLYIWRIVTAGKASLDPARWPVVRPTALYNVLTSLLLLAVGAFQLWFWASRVTQPSSAQDCQQYGFFFAGIRPKSLGFRILNLVLHSLGTLMCVILLLIFVAKEMGLLQRSQNHLIR
jgi:hypothetical protein